MALKPSFPGPRRRFLQHSATTRGKNPSIIPDTTPARSPACPGPAGVTAAAARGAAGRGGGGQGGSGSGLEPGGDAPPAAPSGGAALGGQVPSAASAPDPAARGSVRAGSAGAKAAALPRRPLHRTKRQWGNVRARGGGRAGGRLGTSPGRRRSAVTARAVPDSFLRSFASASRRRAARSPVRALPRGWPRRRAVPRGRALNYSGPGLQQTRRGAELEAALPGCGSALIGPRSLAGMGCFCAVPEEFYCEVLFLDESKLTLTTHQQGIKVRAGGGAASRLVVRPGGVPGIPREAKKIMGWLWLWSGEGQVAREDARLGKL